MEIRKGVLIFVSLFLFLFAACSRERYVSELVIDSVNVAPKFEVSADSATLDIDVEVSGKDADKVSTRDFSVFLTYGAFSGIKKIAPGKFTITISSLNDISMSPVDVEIECVNRKTYTRIYVDPGKPDKINLNLDSTLINSDVGEVEGEFLIKDKNSNPVYLEGVTVSVSYGEVSALWKEEGKYHFKITGLNDVKKSPVTVSVKAGGIEASKEMKILVGTLSRFCIDKIDSPQIVDYPFPIHIKACDKYGNTVVSFDDKVNLSVDVGTITPEVSGRFSNGERYDNVMIHEQAAGEVITASYGGILGRSNPFNVNPQPASKITIDADSTLISADDPGVELTITLENNQGYGIAGKPVKVELFDKGGKKLDDSESNYGMVSSVIDNGDGTYTCFVTELRNVSESPYTVKAEMASLEDEIQISVVPGDMDHFQIDEIPSQRSTFPASLNFIASDDWGNRVYVYSGKVTIVAECDDGNGFYGCPLIVNDPASNPYFNGNDVLYGQSIPGITFSFPSQHDSARIIITDGTYEGTSNEFKVFQSVVGPGVIPSNNYVVTGFRFFVVFDTTDIPVDGSCDFNSTPPKIIAGKPFTFYVVARYYATDPNNPNNTACYQTGVYDQANPFDGNVWLSDSTGSLKLLSVDTEHLSSNFPETPYGSIFNPIMEKYIEVTAEVDSTSNNDVILINPSLRSGLGNGSSPGFPVLPGNVDHIEINRVVSPQIAGSEFNLSAIAEDKEGNVVPLDLDVQLSDKTGTLTPASGQFKKGRLSVDVLVTDVMDGDTITIDGGDAHTIGESNPFDVISPLAVDHFEVHILSDPSNIKVGVPVTYEVIARNPAGNVVDSFNYSVSISDSTGTISPQVTKKFENGILKDSFVVMKTTDEDRIYISGAGAKGVSEAFSVGAGALDHFQIVNIGSPKYVNYPFYITIEAIDIGGNLKRDYEGYHSIHIVDLTGTITPPAPTANFSGGILYQQVKVTEATSSDIIFVGDDNGHNGASNAFEVKFGALNHFACETPQDQVAGYPFHFYCTAYDEYGNVKGDYTKDVTTSSAAGTVTLSDDNSCIVKLLGGFKKGKMDAVVRPLKSCPNTDRLSIQDGTVSTATDWFNIRHDTIYFTISHIDDQVKGVSFTFNIKVTDSSGYLYKNFHGALEIKDLTGTITPSVTDNFNGASKDQEVTINKTSQVDQVILSNYQEDVTESNIFAVHGPPLGKIIIGHIEERQLVNYPFSVTMTAYDIYGNLKDDYDGTVSVDDVTGTLKVVNSSTPKEITFNSGYAVTEVVIQSIRPNGDDHLIVTYDTSYGTKVTYSNNFSVEERKLDHFIVDSISDQHQYINFYITVKAVDLKGNVFENFNDKVNMEDNTGTLSPSVSDYFLNGVLQNQKVRIDQLANSDQIHIYYYSSGVTYEGYSNHFNVGLSTVAQIYFDPISDQTQNVPFIVHMKALDSNGDVVTGFEARVNLSAYVGLQNAITPTQSEYFVTGELDQQVKITQPSPYIFGRYWPITINATLPGVGIFSSNGFIVYPQQ